MGCDRQLSSVAAEENTKGRLKTGKLETRRADGDEIPKTTSRYYNHPVFLPDPFRFNREVGVCGPKSDRKRERETE